MKLTIFNRLVSLNAVQVETLKVAILDAFKQIEYERSLLSDDDKRLQAQMAKIARLELLQDKLFGG